MAWIRTVDPAEAEGPLRELYDRIAGARGGVANVHRIASLNPRALRAHLEIYKAIVFQRSSLPRLVRERIAVVVSAANRCRYCVAHHGEAARQLGDESARIEELGAGRTPADLPESQRALLDWARRAALAPADCGQNDIEALRAHGYDDRAILDATLTVSYFCFVNRLVLVLGVAEEEELAALCGELRD